MTIGIWCGESKPPLNEYLLPLVEELERIIQNGICINSNHIKINFGLVISDSPARATMKGESPWT